MKKQTIQKQNKPSKIKINPFILFATLLGGFFLRIYNIQNTLGFYFDQGRDALVIWDLWHKGKLFLIGPTTGIGGIFRGPFYYYLIAPFYLLGRGNPVYPSVFLSLTTVAAIFLMFLITKKIHSPKAGIISAIIGSFSFYIVTSSRWLSNPTPMFLLSMILLLGLVEISLCEAKEKSKVALWWPAIALVSGLSLFNFGSSGEFFYFPALFVFTLWQRKKLPNPKIILLSAFAFFATAFPLLFFDLRHERILSKNILSFFTEDESFKANFWQVAKTRGNFYYDVFTNKIFHSRKRLEVALLSLTAFAFIIKLPKTIKNKGFKTTLLLFLSPLIGLLFFQGNFGNIYDYYLTGYYFVFLILFSIALSEASQTLIGKLFLLFFLYLFLKSNIGITWYRITDGLDGEHSIGFKNQKQAIDWIYKDTQNTPFNVDVYVPPVIPHAYDYLFLWYGGQNYHLLPSGEKLDILYTLYEVDPPHPERLEAWLERQKGIAQVEKETKFGGITVQKRKRIN